MDLSRLQISGNPPEPLESRLQTLPRPVRYRIYWHYLGLEWPRVLTVPRSNIYSDYARRGAYYLGCGCPGLDASYWIGDRSRIIDTNLAYTSKFFSREVLTYMYSKMALYFQCTCTILYHTSTNDLLSTSLERIIFLWTGFIADTAFAALRHVPLTRMTVVIGAFTTIFLTRQEALFRRFFLRKTTHITQALGIFELLELRGIESVRVVCYGYRVALMSEEDRQCLEHLLVEHVTRRRVE
ncbi:uncharacterized protein F4817DRAFT_365271 [Daldinia loculata]|uniref:uncharacterized protein n=1 Tax=Daldinia loculata TaxID=103429 RepID=UPI0020C59182|nr:uncharacterized protein F4817DRAFT_365271 [Daldinia loculata]KAI1647597.1 hypothetical protein F4817DRAFT_365271 [Daldinia loculata]